MSRGFFKRTQKPKTVWGWLCRMHGTPGVRRNGVGTDDCGRVP